MIKSLEIVGYEAYKKGIKIDNLSKGLNVFVGESDSAKSTIVRSLKWVNENRPQGEGFRSKSLPKKKSVKVTETFYDGTSITREKSSKKNQYILPDGSILKALRSDVPDEVRQITRINPINIQTQHPKDQYFLLGESPGQVAKMFNEVAGLAVMDRAMAAINKRVRSNNSAMTLIEGDIKEYTKTLEELEWTIEATKVVESFSKDYKTIQKLEIEISELTDILMSYRKLIKKIQKYKKLSKAKTALMQLIDKEEELTTKESKIKKIKKCLNSLKENALTLKEYDGIGEAQNKLKTLLKAQETINSEQQTVTNLNSTLSRLADTQEDLKESKEDFNDYKKKFTKLLIKKSCPVCGRTGEIK